MDDGFQHRRFAPRPSTSVVVDLQPARFVSIHLLRAATLREPMGAALAPAPTRDPQSVTDQVDIENICNPFTARIGRYLWDRTRDRNAFTAPASIQHGWWPQANFDRKFLRRSLRCALVVAIGNPDVVFEHGTRGCGGIDCLQHDLFDFPPLPPNTTLMMRETTRTGLNASIAVGPIAFAGTARLWFLLHPQRLSVKL